MKIVIDAVEAREIITKYFEEKGFEIIESSLVTEYTGKINSIKFELKTK